MVSSVGYGTAAAPSTQRASVSGETSTQAAAVNPTTAVQNGAKQDAATNVPQSGVTVSISPEGAAAASRAQRVQTVNQTDSGTPTASANTGANTDTTDSADIDGDADDVNATDAAADGADAGAANVSPVKAFAYGALGLERPDQPKDERNAFYTAGKWLAAGLTIGGLISLLA